MSVMEIGPVVVFFFLSFCFSLFFVLTRVGRMGMGKNIS